MISTRTLRCLVTWVALGGVVGCADNRVSGEVAGARLEVRDAVFFSDSLDPLTPSKTLVLVFSDKPGICERVKGGAPRRDETVLAFTLLRCDERLKHPVGVGTYDAMDCLSHAPSSTNVALAMWRSFDADGKETRHDETQGAPSPVVELEAFQPVPGGRARGSFRAVLGKGRFPVSGDFNATWCDAGVGTPIRRQVASPTPSSPQATPPVARQERGSGPGPKGARPPPMK